MSIIGVARIFSPVFWNKVTKNILSPKLAATIACIISLLSLITMIFIRKEYYFYIIFFIFNFSWAAVLPQIETIAVKISTSTKADYSKMRRWGSIGYIVATILASIVINYFGSIIFMYLLAIINIFLIIAISLIKNIPLINDKKEIENSKKTNFNKKLWLFLLVTFLIQASYGPYYGFFVLFVNKLGWSTVWAGIMLSIGVVSEIFVFSIMKKLLFNFSLKYLFWFSISITIIRWLIFAQFAEYSIMLWIGIILHGLSFAAIHAISMQWISKEISDSNQSMVQALYSGLGFGGGVALGTGIAGFLWNGGTNSSGAFYFAAFCVFIAFILSLYIFDSKKENLTVESYPELAENN